MQPQSTARIQVPPTERLESETERPVESQTVRVVPGEEPVYDEPRNDRLFDQYTIYSKIGNGGMGVVYLARDRRLGRFVAIKRLNHQAQAIPTLRQRFLQEARAVAVLSHVHIVHIYALGEDEDGPFIVMEYIAGPDDTVVKGGAPAGGLVQPNPPLTLDQYVGRHGQFALDEAVDLVLKIGRAVAYAHSSGVIHRDLKPSNILLDKSSEPKIVDFGLARLMRKEESKLTVPGEKLLSLGYGAPEQESDASLSDERSDVYGLGALLYFVLTGQNPRYFREQDVPVQVRDVVVKALATDKEQRWESADAFNEALHQIQTKTRIETPTVKTTWRCKWCDAVNPLAIKFCAECGWDGSENCAECGAETFVGVQYCGNCGADARAYESVSLLLKKMREAAAVQRFERVISCAGRVHGFEPAGPSGRRFLQEVMELRDQAEKNIRRRAQLKEQIPIEMRAENFERAALFIQQYRDLAEDKRGFEDESRQLPELMLRRDLYRARRAIKNREWELSARICDELLRDVAPEHPEVLQIRRAIRLHAVLAKTRGVCVLGLLVFLLYLFSLPVVVRGRGFHLGRGARVVYRPALWVYERAFGGGMLMRYAALLLGDAALLPTAFADPDLDASAEMPNVARPDELAEKQKDYARQLAEIAATLRTFQRVWPEEYVRELDLLKERCRTAGDFDGWDVVQTELKRFNETRQITDVPSSSFAELTMLKNKYRQMLADQRLLTSRKQVALCKKYVNDLTDMQKAYMREGKMDLAAAVNVEIRQVKSSPEQQTAESVLASAVSAGTTESDAPQMLLASTGDNRVEEISKFRAEFEKDLLQAEKDSSKKNAEWPERYQQVLTELMDSFQRAGDYLGWEVVKDEMGRFEADRTVQAQHVVQQPLRLAEVQRNFLKLQEDNKRDSAERVVSTTEDYVKKLQAVQKRLTVGGKMDTAAVVNAEIKRVRSRVDYIEAQNEISPPGPPVPLSLQRSAAGKAEQTTKNQP